MPTVTPKDCAKLYLEKFGWSIIPVRCTGAPEFDKKPLIKWADYQRRRATLEEIDNWWAKWPDAGIGVVTGSISNLCVVDVDLPDLEVTTTPTLTSITGRGGKHYFFHPNGTQYGNFVGVVKGVDIRGEGGYVVVPPSVHGNGKHYKWATRDTVAELPAEIHALISKRELPISVVDKGGRNNAVTSMVGKLVRSGMSVNDVIDMAHAWNLKHCKPPLPKYEIATVCNSIAKIDADKKQAAQTSFNLLTFSELVERYSQYEVNWSVDGWLPKSTVGMIVAPPGSYKTWLLLDLMLAVSTGRDFLGHHTVNDIGNVMVVQQEDPFQMLLARTASIMGLGVNKEFGDTFELSVSKANPPIYWHTERALHFSNKDSVAAFIQAVKRVKPKLILIDPLYSMVGVEDYMASGAQDMLALKKLRDEYGCSIMVAHHTSKKPSGGRERDAVWGSQFLNAWLETGWQVRGSPGSNAMTIHRHFKIGENKPLIGVKFNITDYDYSVDLVDPESIGVNTNKSSLELQIVAAIGDNKFTSIKSLRDYVGGSSNEVSAILKKLNVFKTDKGYLEMVQMGDNNYDQD